jgi:hypothetical protein
MVLRKPESILARLLWVLSTPLSGYAAKDLHIGLIRGGVISPDTLYALK